MILLPDIKDRFSAGSVAHRILQRLEQPFVIGEQEIFEGPSEYDHADGRSHETIAITFEKVPVSGAPLDEVYVSYWGEDPRLSSSLDRLSLEEVRPVLVEWGYGK